MKVYKQCCKNCLLSKDRIVSSQRAKQIIQDCVQKQTHFVCHKASMNDEEIICNTFFEKFGYYSQMVRIAERLGMLEFVDQPESKKLPTYNEMMSRKAPTELEQSNGASQGTINSSNADDNNELV
jgi:hypothetical protein